ncbi:Hypothetical predicted protein [Octopus vulgaris]|uniref:Uncharacterized protein n=1 Tax=Octopus vulgaris TaxID=6645 RepID=A0AA36BTX8_OCTVU|nr:Hypothetical predicted protein [Octopus vulgaris]
MPTVDSCTQTDFLPRKINVSQQVVPNSNVCTNDLNTKSGSTPLQESSYRSSSASYLIATNSPDLKSKSVVFRPEEDIIESKVILDSNEDSTPIVRAKTVSFCLEDDIYEPKLVHDIMVRSASAKTTNLQSLYDFHDQTNVQELDDEIASDSDSFYTAEPMHSSKLSYDSDLGSYVDSGTDSNKSESYHTVEQASDQEEGECLSLKNLKYILGPGVKNVGHGNVKLISVSPCPDICKAVCFKAFHDSRKGCSTRDIDNSTEGKCSSLERRGSQEPDGVPSMGKGNPEKGKKHKVKELNNSSTGVSSVPWPDDFRDFEEIDLEEV